MLGVQMTKLWRFFALFILISCSMPATAQEKTGVKQGFELKPGAARILLIEPSVRVGAQSTGGMFEPNADWTLQAKQNIERELAAIQGRLGNVVNRLELDATDQSADLRRYHALFGAVADSVIEYQFFPGNRLPTKKKDKHVFEWSVGPGLGALRALAGYDYVLMIRTKDAFGSTGRKLLQFAAAFGGIGVKSGEHVGMAGLIDVRTGDLVWLNADLQMGGDVRTEEGANKRVKQLLEGFPGRSVE